MVEVGKVPHEFRFGRGDPCINAVLVWVLRQHTGIETNL